MFSSLYSKAAVLGEPSSARIIDSYQKRSIKLFNCSVRIIPPMIWNVGHLYHKLNDWSHPTFSSWFFPLIFDKCRYFIHLHGPTKIHVTCCTRIWLQDHILCNVNIFLSVYFRNLACQASFNNGNTRPIILLIVRQFCQVFWRFIIRITNYLKRD